MPQNQTISLKIVLLIIKSNIPLVKNNYIIQKRLIFIQLR